MHTHQTAGKLQTYRISAVDGGTAQRTSHYIEAHNVEAAVATAKSYGLTITDAQLKWVHRVKLALIAAAATGVLLMATFWAMSFFD